MIDAVRELLPVGRRFTQDGFGTIGKGQPAVGEDFLEALNLDSA